MAKRRAGLTPLDISSLIDEPADDSDRDPDYNNEEEEVSTDTDTEAAVDGKVKQVKGWNRKDRARPEVRVYMEPPIERADGDTDKDSGNNFLS